MTLLMIVYKQHWSILIIVKCEEVLQICQSQPGSTRHRFVFLSALKLCTSTTPTRTTPKTFYLYIELINIIPLGRLPTVFLINSICNMFARPHSFPLVLTILQPTRMNSTGRLLISSWMHNHLISPPPIPNSWYRDKKSQ